MCFYSALVIWDSEGIHFPDKKLATPEKCQIKDSIMSKIKKAISFL